METYELKTIVPDTSAVVDGAITKLIEEEDIDYPEIIVPEAVVCELEHQANSNMTQGFDGLKELQKLQEANDENELIISFKGKRPTNYDIANAKAGEIDAIIRDVARSEFGTLITNDKVQAETAKAQGIPVYYVEQSHEDEILEFSFEKYFDEDTMSIHLKEGVIPLAKKGKPGEIKLVEVDNKPSTLKQINDYNEEILRAARNNSKVFLESRRNGSAVIQAGQYRIALAKPPFADSMEITVVRPVTTRTLDDYDISDKLMKRIRESAEGILVSGSPGAGKSTFVQALANYYNDQSKVVKTMESPRDLQLPDSVSQYAPLEGDMENTADVLLLVRPDYTVYDELRKTKDFTIFADMRMAGVGMIGVVHATRPIDAIQRISSRVELGVIPSVVDTSIYIEDGEIKAVYETKMTVKVPSGMQEADLARPVIEIRDFETGELKHEIYTYGEQTIVMDVGLVNENKNEENIKSSVDLIAEKEILRKIKKIIPKSKVDVEIVSPNRANIYINEKYVPKIIGKNGARIAEIENEIGISLGVEVLEDSKAHIPLNKRVEVEVIETSKQIILNMGKSNDGENFDVYIGEEYLLTATTSKKGEIKIKKGIELSDLIVDSIDAGEIVTAIRK
ncbi:MAG: PINc/VapC family ATPase [Methanobrevibacter sp.]|nr:PINc/VapC family ATPase [Methanobrevibacter sp.]